MTLSGRQERSEYRSKRRYERPDCRYGSTQVAAMSQDHPDAGSSQRQRTSGQQQWLPKNDDKNPYEQRKQYQDRQKYTYEMMLDQRVSFTRLVRVSQATTQQGNALGFRKEIEWIRRISSFHHLPLHHLQEEMLKLCEQITDTTTDSRGIIIKKEEKLCTRCIIQEVTTLMLATELGMSTKNITRAMSSSSQSRMTKRVSSDG